MITFFQAIISHHTIMSPLFIFRLSVDKVLLNHFDPNKIILNYKSFFLGGGGLNDSRIGQVF
jgi:hypothetical protein